MNYFVIPYPHCFKVKYSTTKSCYQITDYFYEFLSSFLEPYTYRIRKNIVWFDTCEQAESLKIIFKLKFL